SGHDESAHSMKFAFLLFRYFPQSGLARDALGIAERLAARGHRVEFIAGDWQGEPPAGIGVTVIGRRGWSNHRRDADFAGRAAARGALGIAPEAWLLLALGSQFRTKGVDRTVRALAALPPALRQRTWLAVAGQGKAAPLLALARRLGVAERLLMLGACDDVP